MKKRMIKNSDGYDVSKTEFNKQGWFRSKHTQKYYPGIEESSLVTIPFDEWIKPDFDLIKYEKEYKSNVSKDLETIRKSMGLR